MWLHNHVCSIECLINALQRPSRTVTFIMNDLAGLNWNSSTPSPPNPQRSQSQSQAQYSAFKAPSLPSIPRQQTTPLPLQNSGTTSRPNPRSVSSTKAQGHDSFASLLGPSASKAGSATLSLQGRQKQLLAERSKQPLASIPAINASYHATDAHFWEGLGSGRGTPVRKRFFEPQHLCAEWRS